MTKQRAYELAQQELPNCVYYEIKDRAMEIYAAAFAEWTDQNNFIKSSSGNFPNWMKVVKGVITRKTTAELLIEFEKS